MLNLDSKRKHIASNLKRYRLEREWTLERMAEITQLHASTLAKIENEIVVPHDLTIFKLEKRLPGLFLDQNSAA